MPSPLNRLPRTARAALVAVLLGGTALAGVAAGHAQDAATASTPGAIQPTSPTQRLPDFADLAAQVRPAVVSVTVQMHEANDNGQVRSGEARGSGFIIDPNGTIVTNNHVVAHADKVSVTLDDGTELPATVVGRDTRTDLAVLHVDAGHPLPSLVLGDSDAVRPGQWVVAVGNPFGLGGTVTAGIISARGRDIGAGPYDAFLQVDAAINQGNSGGPLFTQDGKVVGVNSAIISPTGGSVGIGFAIPSSLVRDVVGQIRTAGHVTRGYLGVEAQAVTPDIAASLGLKAGTHGALVAATQPDSPAAKAGVQPGDIVESVEGKPVTSPHDLASIVAAVHPGGTAQVAILRDGTARTLSVSVATLPDEQPAAQEAQASEGPTVGLALAPNEDGSAGAMVAAVRPDSAAAKAGLRPGDEVVSVGAHAVASAADAAKAIRAAAKDGHGLALRVMRDGHARYVAIPGALKG